MKCTVHKEEIQPSLRDEDADGIGPWAEAHGYLRCMATRCDHRRIEIPGTTASRENPERIRIIQPSVASPRRYAGFAA
jgi:hypothetical protein